MHTPLFPIRSNRRSRRGSISAQTALMLPVFLGTAALAIDGGFLFVAQSQARVASDSAVLAATSVFEENETEAVGEARAIAAVNAHQVGTSPNATITAEDIHWALWDGEELTLDVAFEDANSAQVDVSEPFAGFFSPFWGNDYGLDGNSESKAMTFTGPAGAVDCFLPIALPHCLYPSVDADDVTENPPPYYLNQANLNLAGWAMPTTENTNTGDLINQFIDPCRDIGGLSTFGDRENGWLQTGNAPQPPVMQAVGHLLSNTGFTGPGITIVAGTSGADPWPTEQFPDGAPDRSAPTGFNVGNSLVSDAARWGYMIGAPVPLVDAGGTPGDCTGMGQLSGTMEIMGFTYGFIYDARVGPADLRGFYLQLDYVNDYDFGTEIDPDAIGNLTADSPPQLIP